MFHYACGFLHGSTLNRNVLELILSHSSDIYKKSIENPKKAKETPRKLIPETGGSYYHDY